jgi:hypothetical protein
MTHWTTTKPTGPTNKTNCTVRESVSQIGPESMVTSHIAATKPPLTNSNKQVTKVDAIANKHPLAIPSACCCLFRRRSRRRGVSSVMKLNLLRASVSFG